ncbi:YvrJ family protein [Halanaerobium sp. Z-7514]|uniref:YvrJ family protein n=1 Tax=Halanaerobium polyolivorans TaxID=2886943 RepID=A0AAW4X2Q3_9FIRM|nr:YvrJ family protein [Halanaerobium polyolivorans]MCC3146068.1 YvrJ family protein [Halanaerobium polyolivorans]
MEELFSLISTYGFPMVLCIYLLMRFETLIRELKKSIDTLIVMNNSEQYNKTSIQKQKRLH